MFVAKRVKKSCGIAFVYYACTVLVGANGKEYATGLTDNGGRAHCGEIDDAIKFSSKSEAVAFCGRMAEGGDRGWKPFELISK